MCALYSTFIAFFIFVNVIKVSDGLPANNFTDNLAVNVTQASEESELIPNENVLKRSGNPHNEFNNDNVSTEIKTLSNATILRTQQVDVENESIQAEQEKAIQVLTRKICETAKKLLGQKTKSSDIENLMTIAAALDKLKNKKHKEVSSQSKDSVKKALDLYDRYTFNENLSENKPSNSNDKEDSKYPHIGVPYATWDPTIPEINSLRDDHEKNDKFDSEKYEKLFDSEKYDFGDPIIFNGDSYEDHSKHEFEFSYNNEPHFTWMKPNHNHEFDSGLEDIKKYFAPQNAYGHNVVRHKHKLLNRRPDSKASTYTYKHIAKSNIPFDVPWEIVKKRPEIAEQEIPVEVARQNFEEIEFVPQNVLTQNPVDDKFIEEWVPKPVTKESKYEPFSTSNVPAHVLYTNAYRNVISDQDKYNNADSQDIIKVVEPFKDDLRENVHKPNNEAQHYTEESKFYKDFRVSHDPSDDAWNVKSVDNDKAITDEKKNTDTGREEFEEAEFESMFNGREKVLNKHLNKERPIDVRPATTESRHHQHVSESNKFEINNQDRVSDPDKYDLEDFEEADIIRDMFHGHPAAKPKEFVVNTKSKLSVPFDPNYITQEVDEFNEYQHKSDSIVEDQNIDLDESENVNTNTYDYAWKSINDNVKSRISIPEILNEDTSIVNNLHELIEEYPSPYTILEPSGKIKFSAVENNLLNVSHEVAPYEIKVIPEYSEKNFNDGHKPQIADFSKFTNVEQNHKDFDILNAINNSKHKTVHMPKWDLRDIIPINNNEMKGPIDVVNVHPNDDSENTNSNKDLNNEHIDDVIKASLANLCNKSHAERSNTNETPHKDSQDTDENIIKTLTQMLIHFKVFGSTAEVRDEMTKFLLDSIKLNVEEECEVKAYGKVLKLVVDFLGYLSREI